MAARCAGVKPAVKESTYYSTSISFINKAGHFSNTSAEERARQSVAWMRENRSYKPRWRGE